MHQPFPVIVLRGDLYSDTGYGRATRALGAVLAGHASHVFAASLHEHASRRQNQVDFPLVSEADLRGNAVFKGAVVVNVCLPESFIRVTGAFNVGYFFWETECLPPVRFWKAHMMKMDRLWAPSRWQADALRASTGRDEIPVIPWPLNDVQAVPDACMASLLDVRAHAAMSPEHLANYLMRCSDGRKLEKETEAAEHAQGRSTRFDPGCSPCMGDLIEREGDLFLAVQTDAPRKGLPLLIANWLQFKASDEGRNAALVIKLSSLDVSVDLFRVHFHASLAVQKARRRCRIDAPDIWFVHDRLTPGEMCALFRRADAFVSTTLGEGFGGPIAEALIEGLPVIAPRHTAIQDALPETYPLAVSSTPHNLKLWNNIDVYSAASCWHIVEDQSVLRCLKAFARMSATARRALAEDARASLLARAGVPAVSRAVRRELELYEGLRLSAKRDAAPAMPSCPT